MPLIIKLYVCHKLDLFLKHCKITAFLEYIYKKLDEKSVKRGKCEDTNFVDYGRKRLLYTADNAGYMSLTDRR